MDLKNRKLICASKDETYRWLKNECRGETFFGSCLEFAGFFLGMISLFFYLILLVLCFKIETQISEIYMIWNYTFYTSLLGNFLLVCAWALKKVLANFILKKEIAQLLRTIQEQSKLISAPFK